MRLLTPRPLLVDASEIVSSPLLAPLVFDATTQKRDTPTAAIWDLHRTFELQTCLFDRPFPHPAHRTLTFQLVPTRPLARTWFFYSARRRHPNVHNFCRPLLFLLTTVPGSRAALERILTLTYDASLSLYLSAHTAHGPGPPARTRPFHPVTEQNCSWSGPRRRVGFRTSPRRRHIDPSFRAVTASLCSGARKQGGCVDVPPSRRCRRSGILR